MQLHKIDTTKPKEIEKFVQFSFDLYKNHPQWVPTLVSTTREILNKRKHPFYAHSTADFFIVENGGEVLGRIAALQNRNYNRYRERNSAFFGYFECVDDQEAADTLFAAVFSWAAERRLTDMIGPRGVIGIDGSVLVEGFEHRPAMGIPYNYPYYDSLIKAAGFEKLTDLLSGYLPASMQLPERLHRIAEKVKKRRGFRVKSFSSKKEIKEWIPRLLAVHREAFQQTRSFYPPTEAEVQSVISTLLQIADHRLVKLIMKEQQIVGFILAYPDIAEGLRRANGRLFPAGWFHLLRDQRRTNWVNINGVGMLPAYQGLGGNAVLYTELQHTLNSLSHFAHCDIVQVDEGNFKSFSDMESLGVRWYKRHRHYFREME